MCVRTVELWNLFFVLLLAWLALLEEKSIATDVDIFAAVCFCAVPSQPLYISSSDVPTCYKNTYLANKNTKTYSTVHVRVCVSTKQQQQQKSWPDHFQRQWQCLLLLLPNNNKTTSKQRSLRWAQSMYTHTFTHTYACKFCMHPCTINAYVCMCNLWMRFKGGTIIFYSYRGSRRRRTDHSTDKYL